MKKTQFPTFNAASCADLKILLTIATGFSPIYKILINDSLLINIRNIYLYLLSLYMCANIIFLLVPNIDIDSIQFLNNYLVLMDGSSDNPGNPDTSGGDTGSSDGPPGNGESGSDPNNSNAGGEGGNDPPNNGPFDSDISRCTCCVNGVCQDPNPFCRDHTENDPNVSHADDTSRNCCNCGKSHFNHGCDRCDCVQCTFCYEESDNNHPGGPNTEHEGEPDSEEGGE